MNENALIFSILIISNAQNPQYAIIFILKKLVKNEHVRHTWYCGMYKYIGGRELPSHICLGGGIQ